MSEEIKSRPWFFNLFNDGDEAIVRLLHTAPSTIESNITHRIEVDGKKKRIRCVGNECPLCAKGNSADKRIYIHLFDYTDNKEKVWDRTDKIMPEIEKLYENWNPLCTAVVKIVRKGADFPRYEITPLNPMQYAQTDPDLVDVQLAKFYSMKRTKEAIEQFIETGKFPEKPAFVPKDKYFAEKEKEKIETPAEATTVKSSDEKYVSMFDPVPDFNEETVVNNGSEDVFDFDPFSSNMVVRPRRF